MLISRNLDNLDGDLTTISIGHLASRLVGFITLEYGSLVTDTGDIKIATFNNEQHIGIGTAAVSGFRVGIDGNASLDGDLVVTGRAVLVLISISPSLTLVTGTLHLQLQHIVGIQHTDDSCWYS